MNSVLATHTETQKLHVGAADVTAKLQTPGYLSDSVSVSSRGGRGFEPRHTTGVKLVPATLSIKRIVLTSITIKAMNFTRNNVLREVSTDCKNVFYRYA